MNSKRVVRASLILLVAALAAAGWWYSRHNGAQDGNRLVLYGNVDIREVDLAFNNSEHIESLLVQEGDRVRKGQLLATLHSERAQAEFNAAQARVASQQAVLARLETGSRPEEIRQARADVAAAEARLIDAESTYKRTQKLYKNRAASKQAVDDALSGLDTARASLKVAQEALALAIEGPRQEEIDEARAMLKASRAELALAQEILGDTELYAPADGIIHNRILEPGDMASPQKPVYTLALVNPVWVRTYVPEVYLGRLAPGMTAEVTTDSYADKVYEGWVGYISPTAEFTPKNVETPELRTRLVYQVRVYVCNPQGELRLGMPATVTIPLDQPQPQAGHSAADCTGAETR
ncbi:MAG TPA: HlyD family efflux transporter periplasmic adaptor subunit [Gammaproteobacteria bacterium]|nr:HlyD family efflux transporter periplasmic adaptor subunit [Gammaproteobacteria bacterium]